MPFVHRSVCALFVTLSLAALSKPSAIAADWPSFRGVDRSAVSKETGLLQEWPADGPPLVWKQRGAGRGYASLAIAGNRIFTLGDAPSTASDKNEYVICFDRENGKPLWKTKTGEPWSMGKPTWQSSRSTPTVDSDLVYVLSPFGDLVCLQADKGQPSWRKNLKKDFDGRKADAWGYSESVLVDGDHVICTPGGEKATMVALEKRTGKVVWKACRPDDRGAGHCSALISTVGGTRVYVQNTGSGPMGVRASDGKVLWTYPIERATAVIPSVIVRDDLVYFSVGYKRGGALLRQVAEKDGDVSVKEIYPLKIQMANKHGGVVLLGDYVYGDTDDSGVPFCAELMTGKNKWKKRGSGRGSASIAAADGHLYLHFANGTMVLANATPEKYSEVGSFKVPGSGERPSWSHPVILDGRLYLREQDQILCYDIRAKRDPLRVTDK